MWHTKRRRHLSPETYLQKHTKVEKIKAFMPLECISHWLPISGYVPVRSSRTIAVCSSFLLLCSTGRLQVHSFRLMEYNCSWWWEIFFLSFCRSGTWKYIKKYNKSYDCNAGPCLPGPWRVQWLLPVVCGMWRGVFCYAALLKALPTAPSTVYRACPWKLVIGGTHINKPMTYLTVSV